MRKLLVVCLFSAAVLQAQFEYGEILGTTRDAKQVGSRSTKTELLTLRTGDHLRIDVQLETGQLTEQVEVNASTSALETDTSITVL